MRDDNIYLDHIAESIALVEQYVIGQDGEPSMSVFMEDVRTQDAVLRRMEILADAASHLSPELKARHPDIQWRRISDFRNALAHAYIHLELDRVWRTIVVDLPALKALVHEEPGGASRA